MSARPPVLPATWQPTFGAIPDDRGTTFRVWATAARSVSLELDDGGGSHAGTVTMARNGASLFEAHVDGVRQGARYRYRLDGAEAYPDPASRFQPSGVHGLSEVVDWTRFEWNDGNWRGVGLDDLVVYELHVGTFTPEGSFLATIDRLPYLVDLGVTALELMPIAAFAGRRNWGYDGVALFAPACQYGRPADLQKLIDAAHRAGLAVLLDVVYNHLGPDGAYLSAFAPEFFSSRHQSPWGDGVNLDGESGGLVRRFLVENALHWIHEYHVDGLRLDATHALVDQSEQHFLAELAATIHHVDLGRPVHIIAEDERNLARIVRSSTEGGWGLDGVWADDFHHEMHRMLTGEGEGYYRDFAGTARNVARTINDGWLYTGQYSSHAGAPRGTDPSGVGREHFVFCLQNHDQVGNRALGERLSHLSSLADCRAAAALLLLAPETPLLFMGEEWAASTPFLYFTDHHDELGRLVTEGRRREFEKFSAFSEPGARDRIPDPQATSTFEASRLRWTETGREPHASMLRLYRALIALRREPGDRTGAVATWLNAATVVLFQPIADRGRLLVARFGEPGRVTLSDGNLPRSGARWEVALTTEEGAFAPDPAPPRLLAHRHPLVVDFARPSAIVLTRG